MLGTWLFQVSRDSFEVPDLGKMSSMCTHKMPNRVQLVKDYKPLKFDLTIPSKDLEVTLFEPNVAEIRLLNHSSTGKELVFGNWTMLVDQGLLITFH